MSESPRSKSEELVHTLLVSPLELPDGASFASIPGTVDIKEMITLSERYLPIINSRPDFIETKIREALDVPFVL